MVAQLVQTQAPEQSSDLGPPALALVKPRVDPHPPTLENIALGLHQCDEASFHITTGMLLAMGACGERFNRLQRWMRYTDHKSASITHELLDHHNMRAHDDALWLIEGLSNLEDEGKLELKDYVTICSILRGQLTLDNRLADIDIDAWDDIRELVGLIVYPEVITVLKPRLPGETRQGLGTINEKTLIQRRTEQHDRVSTVAHALIEAAHHDLLPLNDVDREEACCEDGLREELVHRFRAVLDVKCGCGEPDTLEVELHEHSGTADWECPNCGHTHVIELPIIQW